MSTIWAFGTTRGAEIISFNPNFGKELDGSLIAIPSFSELDATRPTLYMFRKKISNLNLTWVGLYYKAYEVGYRRDGGFFGAGAWLHDEFANPVELLNILSDVASRIRNAAMVDGQFHCKLETVLPKITPDPSRVQNFIRSLTPAIDNIGISLKTNSVAAFRENTPIEPVLNWALRDPSAQFFNSVLLSKINGLRFPENVNVFDSFSSKDTAIVAYTFSIINNQTSQLSDLTTQLSHERQRLQEMSQTINEQTLTIRATNQQLTDARKELQKYDPKHDTDDGDIFLDTAMRVLYYALIGVIGFFIFGFATSGNLDNVLIALVISTTLLTLFTALNFFAFDYLEDHFASASATIKKELNTLNILFVALTLLFGIYWTYQYLTLPTPKNNFELRNLQQQPPDHGKIPDRNQKSKQGTAFDQL